MMRRDISKESIRNPMGELLAPTEYEDDVHAFSHKNRELFKKIVHLLFLT